VPQPKPPGFQTEDNDLTAAKPKEGDTEGKVFFFGAQIAEGYTPED